MITNKNKLPRFIQPRINALMNHVVHNIYGRDLIIGKYPEANDIILQSNDYLCLANHPYVRERLKTALERHDESIFMSAIYLHDNDLKPSLEKRFADFVHFDNCLISQSGWNANTALLQTVCTPESNVYIDFFAHMSMWEGARYANAKIRPFMHNNCDHLRKLIQRHGPGVIVVDSLYSTIGTIAPLAEIVAIAKAFDCATVIDESHSLGVYGTNGAGLLEELGLSKEVDFMTASLAKTFAYRAGAIWTNSDFGQCIPYTGFSNIFSSTIMPYELDTLDATLDVIQSSDDRRNNLFKQTQNLRTGLHDIGLPIRSQSQIIALETGNEVNTKNVRIYLENRGVVGAVFCPPATAKNKNIIRLSMNSSIYERQVEYIISVLYDVMKNEELFIL